MKNCIKAILYIAVALLIISCGKSGKKANPNFPDIDIRLTSGEIINSDRFCEDIIVLSFFEPWCKPCYEELTALQNLEDRFDTGQESGIVSFYGLSLASVTEIQSMCDSIKVSSNNLNLGQVDSSFYLAFDIKEVPIWLILKEGEELLRVTGVHPQGLDSLESFTEHIVFKEEDSDETK